MNHEQLIKLIRDKVDHPATPRESSIALKLLVSSAHLQDALAELVESGALVETRGNRSPAHE